MQIQSLDSSYLTIADRSNPSITPRQSAPGASREAFRQLTAVAIKRSEITHQRGVTESGDSMLRFYPIVIPVPLSPTGC